MDAFGATVVRYGLYVLLIGSVCGWYVYDRSGNVSTGRRIGLVAAAVFLGVAGVVLYHVVESD